MAFEFDIKIFKNVETVICDLRREIILRGGTFEGDCEKGVISLKTMVGSIAGSYKIKDALCNISIKEKPLFITEKQVIEKITEFLEGMK